jgi:NodT family efflux transporter outer membrane factor (OMF) lipoprotein
MYLSHLFIITFLLLWLSGCVPEYKKNMASVADPVPLNDSVSTALNHPEFEVGNWPKINWWEMFEDPQLNRLMQMALRDSPTLKKAQARVEETVQMAKSERARLFPHLRMEYDEAWQYFSKNGFVESFYPITPGIIVPPTANQIDLTLNFDYEFDFWGKNRNKFQAALGEARSMRAEAAQATLILLTAIAQAYFQLQGSCAQYEIIQQQLEERDHLYALFAARNSWGIDPQMPVLASERNMYGAEQALIVLEREIELKRHLLKVLIGQGPDSSDLELPLTASFEQPFPLPENLTADLLARRPDLQAQIWLVESAAKEIGAAKADFYPNVSLSAFGGLESLAFRNLFKIGSKMGGLEPALTLPIFTGGRLTAQLKSKVAAFNEAVYAYNELILQAAQDVADQLILLQTKKGELSVQSATLGLMEEEYDLECSRFKQGVSDYLSVLNLEDQVFNQRFSLIALKSETSLATVKLIQALGGGYEAQEVAPHAR